MAEQIPNAPVDKYILNNGMVVLGERMEDVESAAFDFMLPAGASVMPSDCGGVGNVICDWVFRGAGERSSRELGDALDGLGLHRSSSVRSRHLLVGAALQGEKLSESLRLYGDVIRSPRLEESEFEPARQLAVAGVRALDDDPRRKVMIKLREEFYPCPLGRSPVGEVDSLNALTAERVREIVETNFNLSGCIFALAGSYDFNAVKDELSDVFETGEKNSLEQASPGERGNKYTHVVNEGAQVHIGLMTETVGPEDKYYYEARVVVSVLSGGMSSRLFKEVREKRGLCYSVSARYHALKEAAGVMCYAGTTPDKAQETLEVIIKEFKQLSEGISEEELERAKVGLKSSLILHSESSSSRAGSIGSDYYMLGRVRSLDEIKAKIDSVNMDSLMGFVGRHEFDDFTVVTIGPRELKL